jgi:PAP2 superfamily
MVESTAMHNRNFSASAITQRRMEKAIAGSVLSATTLESCPRFKDSSLLYQVRSGQMTQYTAYTGGCIGISPGCPCGDLNASVVQGGFVPALPGAVTGIIYTVGSIVVSWVTPRQGTGPFRYIVTPYKNGVAQPSVETPNTSYRFTDVDEGATYTFTVCAKNDFGIGPNTVAPTSIVAPPHQFTDAMTGSGVIVDPTPCIQYLLDCGLDNVMAFAKQTNLGPTRCSRLVYLWTASLAQAWNWVSSSSFVSGVVDQWNWSEKAAPLSARDQICWMCSAMDAITPQILVGYPYHSLFPFCEEVVRRVKAVGGWSTWMSRWTAWLAGRQQDGSATASVDQPTGSANWSETLLVDGVTVNPIASYPAPQEWTALAVQGRRQAYLTYRWRDVLSTCLTAGDEAAVISGVQPVVGAQRDAEVDEVMALTAGLTDAQKISAEFWAGGPTTVSPPVVMVWLWREYARSRSDLGCETLLYSLLDLAVHLFESGRMVWGLKAAFFQARPIQEVRRRYAGAEVASWNGVVDGSQWVPYQAASFVTPPFADFPSGHSAFSKSFALVMAKWFGAAIQKGVVPYRQMSMISPLFPTDQVGAFGDFVVGAGASEIQSGAVPAGPLTLSFSSWEDIATGAGVSRLYGGIHCLSAHQGSQLLASQLHGVLQSRWAIPTATLASAPIPLPVPAPSAPVPSDPVPSEPQPAPVPVPAPSEPQPAPVPVPAPSEPQPAPVPAPVPSEPQPAPVPVPAPSEPQPVPYTIQLQYVSQVPSPEIQALLSESIQWIQRLMLHSHGLRDPSVSLEYDMVVDVDMQPLAQGILAGARPTVWNTAVSPAMPLRQSVTLNSNALTSGSLLSSCLLNGQTVVKLIPVMIHEMLHGLGMASLPTTNDVVGWDKFLDSTHTWYIGYQGSSATSAATSVATSAAIQAYQAIVGSQVSRIPVENSFGQGTAYSHWEEGMKDGFVSETRTYDYGSGPIPHPALPNEIMTGIAGTEFYLTELTAGALLDYGYPVNTASDAIGAYPRREVQGGL